jgi:hypothetical protein
MLGMGRTFWNLIGRRCRSLWKTLEQCNEAAAQHDEEWPDAGTKRTFYATGAGHSTTPTRVRNTPGSLKGIFLLLDELEKQDGVLGPTAVVRYLSAMRAIIDALPNHLFMMIAVTPDAMRRYSAALPAFRSRLQNQITLAPLSSLEEATALAEFYVQDARGEAEKVRSGRPGKGQLVTRQQVTESFETLRRLAERRGDSGVRHREVLHQLHTLAEKSIQGAL